MMLNAAALSVLITITLCLDINYADSVHASITNRLGDGRDLAVHCQSADNDLGNQTVAEGSQFDWNFSVNIAGTTLFYCDLVFSEGAQQFHFNAFDYQRDRARCQTECSWIVANEGIYGLNGQTGFWEYIYNWSS